MKQNLGVVMRKSVWLLVLIVCGLMSCSQGGGKHQNASNYVHHSVAAGQNITDTYVFTDMSNVHPIPTFPIGVKFLVDVIGFSQDGLIVPNYESNIHWSANKDIVTVESTSGWFFAAKPGTGMIYAEDTVNNWLAGSQEFTIQDDALDALYIQAPNMLQLPINTKEQLSAIGAFHSLGNFDITNSVHWTSNNEQVVHIVDDNKSPGLIEAVANSGSASITATWSQNGVVKTDTIVIEVSNAKLESMRMVPEQILFKNKVPSGVDLKYQVIGTYSDKHVYNITNQVKFNLVNSAKDKPRVAVLFNKAVATLNPGMVTLRAELEGVSTSANIEVDKESIIALYIRPAKDVGQTALMKRSKLAFKAIAITSDGFIYDVTNSSATIWKSSDTNVIRVQPVGRNAGVATMVSTGKAAIWATFRNSVVSRKYPLTAVDDAIVNINASPKNQLLHKGIPQQYIAVAYDESGYQLELTDSSRWLLTPNSLGRMSSDGLLTPVVDGVGRVDSKFLAKKVQDQTQSKIDKNFIESISINSNGSVFSQNTPISLTAQGLLNNGTIIDLTRSPLAQWSSSNPDVMELIGVNTGNFITKAPGTAIISITFNNPGNGSVESASLNVTVNTDHVVNVSIAPVQTDMVINGEQQFSAVLSTYTKYIYSAQKVGVVRWSSSDSNALSIDPLTGLAIAGSDKAESITVTAQLISNPEITATAKVNILPQKLLGLDIMPAKLRLNAGDKQVYTAAAIYMNPTSKKTLIAPQQVQWSIIGESDVAQVSQDGRVVALSAGTVKLQAQLVTNGKLIPGSISSIPLEINESDTLESIEIIRLDDDDFTPGEKQQYKLISHYKFHIDNNIDPRNISWSSDNPHVATINSIPGTDDFGVVTAESGGVANIAAVLAPDNKKAIVSVKVNSDLQQQSGGPFLVGAKNYVIGDQAKYSAYVNYRFSDGKLYKSLVDVSPYADWDDSMTPDSCIINRERRPHLYIFRGVNCAVAITYANMYTYQSVSLYNDSARFESVVISSSGSNTIHVGDNKVYNLTEFYNNIGSNDVTDAATWLVESMGIVSIDNHGVVTGLNPGTTNILAYYNDTEVVKKTIKVIAKPKVNSLQRVWLVDDVTGGKAESELVMPYKTLHKFSLMAQFSDGVIQQINPMLVSWNSAIPKQVSFIQGRVIARESGVKNVKVSASYTYAKQTLTSPNLTINVPKGEITKLVITPGITKVAVGSSYMFKATAYFNDPAKTVVKGLTSGIIWSAIGTGVMEQTGQKSYYFTGKFNTIPSEISANYGMLRVTDLFTNKQTNGNTLTSVVGDKARLVSVSLESSYVVFLESGEQHPFRLMAHYVESDLDHYVASSDVMWSSDNESIIAVNKHGIAMAFNKGYANISGIYQGESSTITIKVGAKALSFVSKTVESGVYAGPYTFGITLIGESNFAVKYQLDGKCGKECNKLYIESLDAKGTWSAQWKDLPAGDYSFSASEYTPDGNTQIGESVTLSFKVSAKALSFVSKTVESGVYAESYTFDIKLIGESNFAVKYQLDGQCGKECNKLYIESLDAKGTWSAQWKDLPAGDYSFSASEYIPDGNTQIGESVTLSFKVVHKLIVYTDVYNGESYFTPFLFNRYIELKGESNYVVKYQLDGSCNECNHLYTESLGDGTLRYLDNFKEGLPVGHYSFSASQYTPDGTMPIGESFNLSFKLIRGVSVVSETKDHGIYAAPHTLDVTLIGESNFAVNYKLDGPCGSTCNHYYNTHFGADGTFSTQWKDLPTGKYWFSQGESLPNEMTGLISPIFTVVKGLTFSSVTESGGIYAAPYTFDINLKGQPKYGVKYELDGKCGSKCNHLYTQTLDGNGTWSDHWKDLPVGDYSFSATQYTADGKTPIGESINISFKVVQQKFTLDSATKDGGVYAALHTFDINLKGQPKYGVKYELDGPCGSECNHLYTRTLDGNGTWSDHWKDLPKGSYTFSAAQYAPGGDTPIGESINISFKVVKGLTFSSVTESGGDYAAPYTFHFTLKGEPEFHVKYHLDGPCPHCKTVYTGNIGADGTLTDQWEDLPKGSYTFSAAQYALDGVTQIGESVTLSFKVVKGLTINDPGSDNGYFAPFDFKATGTGEPNSRIRVYLDGPCGKRCGDSTAYFEDINAKGNWTTKWDQLPVGNYKLKVYYYISNADVGSPVTLSFKVVKGLTITDPLDSSSMHYFAPWDFKATGTGQPNSRIRVYLDGPCGKRCGDSTAYFEDINAKGNWTTKWDQLPVGNYKLKVYYYISNANVGSPVTSRFTVLPQNFTFNENNYGGAAPYNFFVSGTAQPTYQIKFYLDGPCGKRCGNGSNYVQTVNPDGSWATKWDQLPAGIYTFNISYLYPPDDWTGSTVGVGASFKFTVKVPAKFTVDEPTKDNVRVDHPIYPRGRGQPGFYVVYSLSCSFDGQRADSGIPYCGENYTTTIDSSGNWAGKTYRNLGTGYFKFTATEYTASGVYYHTLTEVDSVTNSFELSE